MINTLIGIGIILTGALVLEFVTLESGWPTISRTTLYLGLHWNPFVIVVIGILYGHFTFNPDINLAKYIDEAGEVFIVCWITWGFFMYFRGNPDLLPLSNLERLGIVIVSIAIGAFVWTIEGKINIGG